MSRLLKGYTNQITQNYKKGKHNGIDLVGYKSKTCWILAHSDGIITSVRSNCNKTYSEGSSYGNYVKIKHGNFTSVYAHLKYGSVKVKKGDFIKKGKEIGYMGNTGHSKGAHLHFEILDSKGNKINPIIYLEKDLPKEETWEKGKYELIISKAIRKEHSIKNNIVLVKECIKSVKPYLTSSNPNDQAFLKIGTVRDISKIYYDKEGRVWGKMINTWIVLRNKEGIPQAKKVK